MKDNPVAKNAHKFNKSQVMKDRKKAMKRGERKHKGKVDEKLSASDDAGEWVKDFRKSDAPQFRGKSDKKKQQMAIAAYLDAKKEKREAMEEKKGLWDRIHAKRKRGEAPAKPGDKDYPKTLDVGEGLKQARKNVGSDSCWDGYKAKGTKMKGGKEVPDCKKEEVEQEAYNPRAAAAQRNAANKMYGRTSDTTKKPKSMKDFWKAVDAKYGNPKKKTGRYAKEEVEIEENVHDRYMRVHGKKAKGHGRWIFTTSRNSQSQGDEFVHRGDFSAAHKAAQKHFGTKNVYVMESTAAYGKSMANIRAKKQRAGMTSSDRNKMGKVADMMRREREKKAQRKEESEIEEWACNRTEKTRRVAGGDKRKKYMKEKQVEEAFKLSKSAQKMKAKGSVFLRKMKAKFQKSQEESVNEALTKLEKQKYKNLKQRAATGNTIAKKRLADFEKEHADDLKTQGMSAAQARGRATRGRGAVDPHTGEVSTRGRGTGETRGEDKNLVIQLRKAQDLDGNYDIEVTGGKKVKLNKKQIDALLGAYDKTNTPAEKKKWKTLVTKELRKKAK